ncbi:MAG TPA: hypothetical protein PK156_00465 [Polyangium sp.]|nr:hypothetical protein [Polyangium sp.]
MRVPASKSLLVVVLGMSGGLPACGEDKPSACTDNGSCTNDSSSSTGSDMLGDLSASVTKYDVTFDVTTARANSRLALDVAAPGGTCWDVSCEVDNVSNVMWNGATAASAVVSNGKLRSCGPGVLEGPTLTLGADVDVALDVWFGLDVGFSRRKNLAGGTFTYLLSWVGGCDRFGPCDDEPGRLAGFQFEVTHPENTVALCPGTRLAGTTNTTCTVDGAPTYSAFAVAADTAWVRNPWGTFAGVDFFFYGWPSQSRPWCSIPIIA